MTHMRQVDESEGTLSEPEPAERKCPRCGQPQVTHQDWRASDGGVVDSKYTCAACGHVWWVDGIDS